MIAVPAPAREPVRQIAAGPARRGFHAAKRLLDVVLSALLLVVLAPLLAVIALAIRLDSPGSPIFVQDRVGSRRRVVDGRSVWELTLFRAYKFRSMRRDADPRVHERYVRDFVTGAAPSVQVDAPFKLEADPRVTRVGALLRRTSLDELPQLVNVLLGSMSLVGPRPVPPYEVALYAPHHFERFGATPGITGLWQVHGRGVVPFERMIEMDVEYVRRRCLRLDLELLARTLPAVVSRRGAA